MPGATMPAASDYVTGTLSVTNGSINFTGTSTGWLLAGFKEGDTIIDITGATEYMGVIATIDANGAGTLTKAWEGPTLSNVAYRMRYQPDGARVSAQARNLIELLGNGNLQAVAGLSGSANQLPMFTGPGAMTLVSKTELVSGANYDVQVADLAARAAYDAQVEGYAVLVADTGDGRAAIYSKVSATSGDWSDPAYVTGPVGPPPDVQVGSTTTLDPGQSATVVPTPISGGVSLAFGIPEGRGARYAGEYDAGTAYALDDAVLDNGSTWIALQATTGNAPPVLPTTSNAYWSLLARQGTDGAGTGDVVGPSSSGNENIALYDGTTGKVIKDSGVTIADLDPTGVVKYNEAQALSVSEKAQARTNINSPASVDVRRNRIVNHDMTRSQENGTTSGTTNGRYPVDQWAQYFVTSAGTLTVAQVASVTPAGSPNRLRATVTVADASLAAGEFWTLTQNLEGSNVADFRYGSASAKNCVLRFGFKGPAGTYAVHLGNSAANRSYVALFTIGAGEANTDTVQTLSIPGDTTGTWLTADGVIGITLDIVLACGSTFQGSTGWQAGNILGTSGVSNGMGTGSAVFELFDVGLKLDPDATGVYGQYEVGEVHPVYRSERYYTKKLVVTIRGYAASSSANLALSPVFPIEMCKAPAVVSISATASSNVSAEAYEVITATGFRYRLTSTSSGDTFVLDRLVQCNARLS